MSSNPESHCCRTCCRGTIATSTSQSPRNSVGTAGLGPGPVAGDGARVALLPRMRTVVILAVAILMGGSAIGCSSTPGHAADAGADTSSTDTSSADTGSVDTGGVDGACSACTQAGGGLDSCPSDVATAASCSAVGSACCAGGAQWHCGRCIAETCHWFQSCTPVDFDAGGQCNDAVSCPSHQTCIVGGTCAVTCQLDAGTCAVGTSCGTATWYFNPVFVAVCH